MRLLATAFPRASTAWLTSPRAHSAQATWSGSSPHHRPPDPLGAWANPRRLRTRDVVRHLVRCPASLFLVGHAWATVPRTGPRCVHPTRCPPSRQAPNAKDVEHGRGRPGAAIEAVATTGVFAGAVSGTSHKDELSPSGDFGQESLLGSPAEDCSMDRTSLEVGSQRRRLRVVIAVAVYLLPRLSLSPNAGCST
jgi:hypothetical protein